MSPTIDPNYEVNATSITFSVDYVNASINGYIIYIGDNRVFKVVGGDNANITVDRLVPNRNYSIMVRAYQDLVGPATESFVQTTDKGK